MSSLLGITDKEIETEEGYNGLKAEIKVELDEIQEDGSILENNYVGHGNESIESPEWIKNEDAGLIQFEITEVNQDNEEVGEASCPVPGSSKAPVIKCDYCDKVFPHPRYLYQHISITHPGFPRKYSGGFIECQVCRRIYDGVQTLAEHVQEFHPEEKKKLKFECAHCGSKWKFFCNLKNHISCHRSEKPFRCDICSKTFKTREYMKCHKRLIHVIERNFQCPECPKAFKSKIHLKNHSQSHITGQSFQCEKCDHICKTMSGLYNHKANYHRKKTIRCTICSKTFALNCQLKDHMKKHSDERPFECHICHKRFKEQQAVRSHLKLHEFQVKSVEKKQEKKKHKCKDCNKMFKKSYELKSHAVLHRTEAKFKCQHCPRSFKGEQQLRHHFNCFHSGEGTCSFCGKVFPGQLSLKRHENYHKRSVTLQCHLCKQSYKKKLFLLSHLTSVHNMSKEDAINCTKDSSILPGKAGDVPEESITIKTESEAN